MKSTMSAAVRPWSAAEEAALEALRSKAFVGTGSQVGEKLRSLAAQLQVEELARALESNVLALEAMASALEDGHGEAVVEGMAGLASATLDLVAAQRVLQAPAEG